MKLVHTTGCLSHDVDIDDTSIMFLDVDELKKDFEYIISNLNEHTNNDLNENDCDTLENCIKNLIVLCSTSKMETIEYGYDDSNKNEIYITYLKTKSFLIRYFQDYETGKEWITVDNDYCFTFLELKNILLETFEEYISNSRFLDSGEINLTINSILCDIVQWFGSLTSSTGPCECCGDYIWKYTLEI